jgi:hypothetical protein
MTKTTVGKEAYDRLLNPDTQQGIVDTQREIDKEYFEQIEECVKAHRNLEGFEDGFFVIVIAKKERTMENVVRRYFMGRRSLPTPNYDQTVWQFHPQSHDVEFIWCLPDCNTCQEMFHHPNLVPDDEQALLMMVQQFMSGKLYHNTCKRLGIEPEVDTNPPVEIRLADLVRDSQG